LLEPCTNKTGSAEAIFFATHIELISFDIDYQRDLIPFCVNCVISGTYLY
jgi:hypothetical protein